MRATAQDALGNMVSHRHVVTEIPVAALVEDPPRASGLMHAAVPRIMTTIGCYGAILSGMMTVFIHSLSLM